MNKRTLFVIALLALCGCAVNGFQKFYSPASGLEAARPMLEHADGDPKVFTYSEDPRSDVLRAREAGYVYDDLVDLVDSIDAAYLEPSDDPDAVIGWMMARLSGRANFFSS